MDYNSMISSELPTYIERIIRMVDKYSEDYKINDVIIEVDDEEITDLGNYISSGSTCEFYITVKYSVSYQGEQEDSYRSFTITVPRMIEGIFILNGKYRMLSHELGEDYTCRLIGDYFRISYLFSYNISTKLFSFYDEESEDQIEMDYDQISIEYPEKLNLTERMGYKLKIRLNLDYVPTVLTKELLDNITPDKFLNNDIIDKRVLSIESLLLSSIRNRTLEIVKGLNHNFYKVGSISGSLIQNVINNVFNGQSLDKNPLNSSANVNPISFDSTNEKIIIDNSDYMNLSPGNYDVTMSDIIDPVVTPDNANINRINYLTKAATMKDGQIAIKCYDKNFSSVVVDYVKYLASKVLLESEVESYENSSVLKKSKYKVKINRSITESRDYDYIEPSSDDRLSVESRMIPMLNMSDSVRGSMAAKMVGQAVPLADPDEARVQSGHEGDNDSSTTDIKYEGSKEGKVIKADEDSVIIMVDAIPKEYKVPVPVTGIYDITAAFSPKVKVGDIVKRGDTLITHDISKTGLRNLGLNALVALRPYRGYNYEDGIVISESFAKRASHWSLIDLKITLNSNQTLVSIAPVGSLVNAKDVLVHCISNLNNSTSNKILSMIKEDPIQKSYDLVTPNNIEDALVTDVKIDFDDYVTSFYGREVNRLNEESKEVINEFKKKKIRIPSGYPKNYLAKLPASVDYDGFACCIRYRLLVKKPAIVGSKLCSRFGLLIGSSKILLTAGTPLEL